MDIFDDFNKINYTFKIENILKILVQLSLIRGEKG